MLQSLIEEGILERPKRTIRLLLIPEFTGTYAYLEEHRQELSKRIAGFNLDMVAGTQGKDAGPLIIVDTPDCSHSFSGDLGEAILQTLSRECAFGGDQVYVPMFSSVRVPFVFGSDHYILSDPTIDIPTVALTQWPDKTYHTSVDSEAHVDSAMLERAAAIAASFCYIQCIACNVHFVKSWDFIPYTIQCVTYRCPCNSLSMWQTHAWQFQERSHCRCCPVSQLESNYSVDQCTQQTKRKASCCVVDYTTCKNQMPVIPNINVHRLCHIKC